jgi:hypothetical protein
MVHCAAVNPCFGVGDIGETMDWYQRNLGFTADPFPQRPPFVFCILQRDEIEIMLQRIDGYQKPELYHLRPGGVWDAYIRVAGVKNLYEAVRNKVDIVQHLHQQPYGLTEFEVNDPNGYVLVFSEETRKGS